MNGFFVAAFVRRQGAQPAQASACTGKSTGPGQGHVSLSRKRERAEGGPAPHASVNSNLAQSCQPAKRKKRKKSRAAEPPSETPGSNAQAELEGIADVVGVHLPEATALPGTSVNTGSAGANKKQKKKQKQKQKKKATVSI